MQHQEVLMKLEGKTAIVTGGGSGLGLATVEGLVERGANVHAFDLSFPEHWKTIKNAVPHIVDVRSTQQIEAALARVVSESGGPSILVNAAGMAAPFKRTYGKNGAFPLDLFKNVLDVNLTGSFNCARLVAERMAKLSQEGRGERGVIVHVASINAIDSPQGTVAYSAAKAGVAGMTLAMARDLAQYGIRVCCVAPGSFETPMLAHAFNGDPSPLLNDIPFPNDRLGQPPEFAALVEHICENSMLNGATIRIDAAARLK